MVARSLLRHLRGRGAFPVPVSVSVPAAAAARCISNTRRSMKAGGPTQTTPPTSTATTLTSAQTHSTSTQNASPSQNAFTSDPAHKPSWLAQQVHTSPTARRIFTLLTHALGYGSTAQVAGRRAYEVYRDVCAVRADEERGFWVDECFLPPTFQSWFTITNLHIWMLTVRLRALPPAEGKAYQQALIDHFFMDVEDRVRAVLQPDPEEEARRGRYTFDSGFYRNPNAPVPSPVTEGGKKKKLSRAPDRIVKTQMRIFKEQWAGMGLSLDLGLVTSDMELAGAVWRNVLGARGARGIAYPSPSSSSENAPQQQQQQTQTQKHFRRAVNLVGGEAVNVAKIDLEKEEATDDGSGVHDFAPAEVDRYLGYPGAMLDVVAYLRRELVRLECLADAEVVAGDVGALRFGKVRG